jgi:predicted amidophosphoribosyltransferase
MGFVSAFASFLLDRCPSCGLSATTLCPRCWYILNEINEPHAERGLLVVATEPFIQRVLYRWDDRKLRQADILRDVILASKENPRFKMMELWGAEFYRRAMLDGLLASKRDWIIVPPPGRSGGGEHDHAGALGYALAEISGDRLFYENFAFERAGQNRKSQKTKSRKERGEIKFQVSDIGWCAIQNAEGFIFIDDVIATGATAKAAWVALGKPRKFECWAIAAKVRESIGPQVIVAQKSSQD